MPDLDVLGRYLMQRDEGEQSAPPATEEARST